MNSFRSFKRRSAHASSVMTSGFRYSRCRCSRALQYPDLVGQGDALGVGTLDQLLDSAVAVIIVDHLVDQFLVRHVAHIDPRTLWMEGPSIATLLSSSGIVSGRSSRQRSMLSFKNSHSNHDGSGSGPPSAQA